jgi:hypothetical protein
MSPTYLLFCSEIPPSSDGKGERRDSSKSDSSKSDKSEGPDSVRLNVRKGLRDALAAR